MAADPGDDVPVAPAGVALDARQRRRLLIRAIARIMGVTVLLLAAYFAAPIGQDADVAGIVILVVGLGGFVVLIVHQVRQILDSPTPQLRATEALATALPIVIVTFALFYVAVSDSDPSAFTSPITKVNGLYFTVTVLTTVGFGDITASTDFTRLAVTAQMIIDLIIIGVVVKLILGASRIGVERRRAEAEADAREHRDGEA